MIIDGIPLRLWKTKKKLCSLNLNNFRNLHYQANNKMKHQMHAVMQEKCRGLGKPELPVELIYTIYRKDKRNVDLNNIGAIVDKFATDGLVLAGMIPDDSVKFIKKISYVDGGIDKNNPRATLEIKHYPIDQKRE